MTDSPREATAVTAEITGVMDPAAFARIPDALSALWTAMRPLPLGQFQYDAYEFFFTRPEAAECVEEFLRRDGLLGLTFTVDGRPYSVRVRPADPKEAPSPPP